MYKRQATDNPLEYSGDYVSPEQIIPQSGFKDSHGRNICWEACITMNDNWGYAAKDKNFKPAEMIIKKLVECVSKNGNMLLNVGPDAKGNIPDESIAILEKIGEWMRKNKESIYGCGGCDLPKPENGRITRKGKTLYYHIMENSIGGIPLQGISLDQVESIRLVCDGTEIQPLNNWIVANYPDVVFVEASKTVHLPDSIDTVIAVNLK